MFYGGTYTARTPVERAMQQLGLSITKGYGLLLRQASTRIGVKPVYQWGGRQKDGNEYERMEMPQRRQLSKHKETHTY